MFEIEDYAKSGVGSPFLGLWGCPPETNPNAQTRNPKQIQNLNEQNSKRFAAFEFGGFDIV